MSERERERKRFSQDWLISIYFPVAYFSLICTLRRIRSVFAAGVDDDDDVDGDGFDGGGRDAMKLRAGMKC